MHISLVTGLLGRAVLPLLRLHSLILLHSVAPSALLPCTLLGFDKARCDLVTGFRGSPPSFSGALAAPRSCLLHSPTSIDTSASSNGLGHSIGCSNVSFRCSSIPSAWSFSMPPCCVIGGISSHGGPDLVSWANSSPSGASAPSLWL